MDTYNTIYAEFAIERSFKASTSKLYQMFADKASKEQWFKGPNDAQTEHIMDFRVGGDEYNSGTFHDGIKHIFKAHYYDIVPNQRIVYSYEMYMGDNRISVSLATLEFIEEGEMAKLSLRESGVFLDGFDKPEYREYGSKELLNALEAALQETDE
jgi:uncharacterized protein YndB with AHSA1/START domain